MGALPRGPRTGALGSAGLSTRERSWLTSPRSTTNGFAAVCSVLLDHEVDFVVIGGVAARLHETGHATVDIDICPSSVDANLERLAAALRAVHARLRVEGDPAGIPFDPHPQQLRQMSTLTSVTSLGPVDLCFRPAGFPGGYEALVLGRITIVVSGVDVPVAALADVIASKRSAGRARDIVALPILEARLRERDS